MNTSLNEWLYHRRKAFAILGAAGLAYYCSQKLGKSRKAEGSTSYFSKLWHASQALSSACVSSTKVLNLVASDLHGFLNSDSSEVPQSLLQLAKIVQHKDVQSAIQSTVNTVVASTVEHVSSSIRPTLLEALDRVIAAALSEQGRSIVGLAAGKAARNAVNAFCEYLNSSGSQQPSGSNTTESLQQVVALLTSEQGEQLLRTLIAASTTSAVGTYVDKTAHINVVDDFLSSVSREEHLRGVQAILASVCKVFVREVSDCYSQGLLSGAQRQTEEVSPAASSLADAQARTPEVQSAGNTSSSSGLPSECRPQTARSVVPSRVPGWLDHVVTLTGQPEVQSLAVALTKSTVHEVVETLVNSDGASNVKYYVGLSVSKMYTVMSVMSALLLYAVSS